MLNKKKLTQQQLFLPIVCVLLVLAVNIVYDVVQGREFYDFFKIGIENGLLSGRIISILNRGSEVAILSIGMTLVVSASAGTDISVGSVMSLSASFCVMLIAGFGVSSVSSPDEFAMPMVVGLLGALLMGVLCGAFNGTLVAYLNIQPMVATLILWSAGRAIGLLLCNNLIVYIRVPEFGVFGGYVGPIPTPIIIAAVCIVIVTVLLKKTALGMYIQSVGINKKASRIAGLNSQRIIFFCYVLCGLCAGIAGIVASSRITSADSNNIGLDMEMGRHPGGGPGRQQPGRRPVQPGRLHHRRLHHPGHHHHHVQPGRALRGEPGVQGGHRHPDRGDPGAPAESLVQTAQRLQGAGRQGGGERMKKPANALRSRKSMNSNTLLLYITIVLFVLLYAAGCVVYGDRGFTNLQTFLNLFRTNAGLICVACGITCVMLTGGIDISVGSLVALDCMLLAYGMSVWGLSAPVMILIVLAVGLVFGLVQGICVGYLEIQPFIVTMAGLFFARGMVSVISTEQLAITADVNETFYNMSSFRISLPFGGTVNRAGKVILPYIGIGVVIALVVLVAVFLMLRYTKFGRSLYAVGGNEQSAAMMGLDVKRTKLKAYVLCSLLCSIGGICYCLNTMMASTTQATGMEMDAISSAVIGGTLLTGGVGNVIGTLFGVLINGTISTIVLTNGKLASSWPNILTAVLLCFFIVLQSIFARIKEKNK